VFDNDGRERVVTEPSAFKIRAEDGRAVTAVNISPFINNLPQGRDTQSFSTGNASGSTSQATNIMEALATDTATLLVDEDTCATNFMIRDQRMQALVAKEKEPITPLVQRIRDLYQNNGVSVVMVMGGSGDFFGCADNVIMLDNYIAHDVTAKAKALAPTDIAPETNLTVIQQGRPRIPKPLCLSPRFRRNKDKIQAFATRALRYGQGEIDLSRVEQLVDNGQLQAIGYLISYYHAHFATRHEDMVPALRNVLKEVELHGLDLVTPFIMGTLAMPRIQELAAAVNRMRNLELVEDD